MRRFTILAVLVGVLVGGYIGVGMPGAPSQSPTATPSQSYPNPPPNTTDGAVQQAAIAYEEAYVHNQLRHHYEEFRVSEWKEPRAEILNRSDGGVYVRVTVTYSYSGDDFVADGRESTAVYFVDTTTIRRIHGSDIAAN